MQYYKMIVNEEQIVAMKNALQFYQNWLTGRLELPSIITKELGWKEGKDLMACVAFLKEVKSLIYPDLAQSEVYEFGSQYSNGARQNKVVGLERDTAWELFRDIYEYLETGKIVNWSKNYSGNLPLEIEKYDKIFYTI